MSQLTKKPRTRISSLPGVFALLIVTSGCSLEIQTAHEPMHPIGEPVVVRATATGYVDKIELWIGESQINSDGSESVVTSLSLVKTCNPTFWVRSLTCIHIAPAYEDGRIIDFKGTAKRPFGSSKSEVYRFAAGVYPLEEQPIPIRVKGNVLEKLDIVMIRDIDVGPTFFRLYLDDVIEKTFFEYSTMRDWRGLYNFYYSVYDEGTYSDSPGAPCEFGVPQNMAQLEATSDVIIFLHVALLKDCKETGRFSSELWFDKTVIHESGHALFGVRDEYPFANDNLPSYRPGPQDYAPNIWSSQAMCSADAPGLGLNPADCVLRSPPNGTVWKIDPEGPTGCIMNAWTTQWQAGSDFGPACLSRSEWRYKQCVAGTCMALP